MNQPKYISYEGGGVLGSAHVGVKAALEELNLDSGIVSVNGASAGGIMAACHSMRLGSTKIKSLIDALDYSTLRDGNIIQEVQVVKYFGIHPGDVFLSWI